MSPIAETKAHVHGYTKDKDALVKRLHRIEGRVAASRGGAGEAATCSTP